MNSEFLNPYVCRVNGIALDLQNNRGVDPHGQTEFKFKVLFVEDDQFTSNTIAEILERFGVTVCAVHTVSGAITALKDFEPNVVVTDLDLGAGPDGTDLLNYVHENYPWIGQVILTAHSSPALAVSAQQTLPEGAIFLIKALVSGQDIYDAIMESVEIEQEPRRMYLEPADGIFIVSKSQAELLRMLADGLSNAAIARKRNRSLPATESLIHRLFASLGLNSDPDLNQRVIAVKMWQQGKVRIK